MITNHMNTGLTITSSVSHNQICPNNLDKPHQLNSDQNWKSVIRGWQHGFLVTLVEGVRAFLGYAL
jgi:hypothetical protein